MKYNSFIKLCLLLGFSVLAACGGGSSGSSAPPVGNNQSLDGQGTVIDTGTGTVSGTGTSSANATNFTESNFAKACGAATEVLFARTEQAKANANVELIALACGAPISAPLWEQSAGTPVSFLSARSQAITFEPASPGQLAFRFSYVDAQGKSQSRTVQFAVSAADAQAAPVIRGEPSVWPSSATSLRVWLPGYTSTQLNGATYQWTSSVLASTTLLNTSAPNLIITPNAVTDDTVAPIRVDVRLQDGTALTQVFNLLVAKPDANANSGVAFKDAAQVYPYVVANNPYASLLKKCTYARSISYDPDIAVDTLCTLSDLPVLGTVGAGGVPSVEQIMQRVLVSNDWMGANFERLLREQDNSGQLRRMLASTTAVVIGGRVRPSFFWSLTGAIYLDADYLWLTPEQRDTISERPDYRGALSAPFSFQLSYADYEPMQGNAAPYLTVASRGTRSMSDLRSDILSLMVHELTHAADNIPSTQFNYLSQYSYPVEASYNYKLTGLNATGRLQSTYPLRCRDCFKLGAVLFQSWAPTSAQKALTAADIVRLFEPDDASDFYAYSVTNPDTALTSPEDTAMLAEEAIMQLSYGFRRKVYILNQKIVNGKFQYTFEWGQSSRIGKPSVRQRAALVLSNTAPWIQPIQLSQLEAPTTLVAVPGASAASIKASIPDFEGQQQIHERINRQLQDRALRQAIDAKLLKPSERLGAAMRAKQL